MKIKKIENPEKMSWWVHEEKVRTDYPVIRNLQQYIAPLPPILPKAHPVYVKYWSQQSKRCIEGIWGEQEGKFRYMPGNLYFFGSFTVLEDTQEINGVMVTKHFKPRIVDYFWEFAYQSWAAYGFSGFDKDDLVTCNFKVKDYEKGELEKEYLPSTCIREDGEVKAFVDPYVYLNKLHSAKLGKCLFQNEARDTIIMGTRSGGKSFWSALGELEYNFVFGGAKRYDKDFLNNKHAARQVAGSVDTTKSSELYDKFSRSQEAKTNHKDEDYKKWFGIYSETYTDIKGVIRDRVTACPFHKKTIGNLECPNKKNPLRAGYKRFINGDWEATGTGSEMVHVNYSDKKGDGAQAAVGGRYLFSAVEEIGLVKNYIDILGSNDSATRRNGRKFGVQAAFGTSGNIEYVQEAKKVFLNPGDYGMLHHNNVFSKTPIGYFIPNYLVHFQFKDDDGNTDYKRAISKINKDRYSKALSDDPKVLRDFTMNEPVYLHEMWVTDRGSYLPYEELAARERELMNLDYYKILENCVTLAWDSSQPEGVSYKIKHDGEPFRSFPIEKAKRKKPTGEIVIYDFPQKINGKIPPDMYRFVGHDTYVQEDIDKGGSIGSTYILMNPKYAVMGFKGNTIVASYNDKPVSGLDEYYENQSKLLAMYGNPPQGLMFENNRGSDCRAYYMRKNKLNLLAPTPQHEQGNSIYQKNIMSFGYVTGSKNLGKVILAQMMNSWLLDETELSDGVKKNVERIPCLFLVRQMMQYDLEGNFDAVDGFRGAVLALREYETAQINQENQGKAKKNSALKHYYNNSKIFKNARNSR